MEIQKQYVQVFGSSINVCIVFHESAFIFLSITHENSSTNKILKKQSYFFV